MLKLISDTEVQVTLETAITRGDTAITTFIVKRPVARTLGNISQTDVMQQNIRALAKILPQITEPQIQEAEFWRLPVSDTAILGAAVSVFFMSTSQRQALVTELQGALDG